MKKVFLFLNFILMVMMASWSKAKDLHSHLGIGYKHPYASVDFPTATVRYYTFPYMALDIFMGVNTKEEKDLVGLGVQVSRIFFTEEYAHVYFGASGSYLSLQENMKKKSGFEIAPLLGCELFLPHISSISFSIEMGLALVLIDSKSNLQTFARTPLKAGILFYF